MFTSCLNFVMGSTNCGARRCSSAAGRCKGWCAPPRTAHASSSSAACPSASLLTAPSPSPSPGSASLSPSCSSEEIRQCRSLLQGLLRSLRHFPICESDRLEEKVERWPMLFWLLPSCDTRTYTRYDHWSWFSCGIYMGKSSEVYFCKRSTVDQLRWTTQRLRLAEAELSTRRRHRRRAEAELSTRRQCRW